MSEKPSPLASDDESSSDRLRLVLTLCCVVAVVLAGTVVPALPSAGLGQSPVGSAVPQPGVNPYGQPSGSAASAISKSGGLGALNPGSKTGVGGSLAANESAFRSRNAAVHFTVRSSAPSYWRTGAYDAYTGSGWKRTGDREPYTGPLESGGIRGERVEYQVTLAQSATALPSVWRAASVSRTEGVSVTDQRGLVSDDPLPAGTTYSGVSYRPPRDPTVLGTAGRDYPEEIRRRYTALPDATERRVAPFTSNLTEGADSPYETAKRIETWLEANKNYSLDVPEPEGDVASQFIFEMEKGYCEYYATAMAVMLRSQGIPARYVVGYSTGQQVGSNAYKVRAMNAHAWVEAYFPGVGWVRFDPTPGSARLQAEQAALRNQTGATGYNHTESGSPGERFSPNASGTTATRTAPAATAGTTGTGDAGQTPAGSSPTGEETPTATTTGDTGGTPGDTRRTTRRTTAGTTSDPTIDPDSTASGGYMVELNRTPVPGAIVEVTVFRNTTRLTGVVVAFNGEQVGVTDDEGTVTARVPYAETLEITISDGENATALAPPTGLAPPPLNLAAPPLNSDAPMALAGPSPSSLAPGNQTNGTEYALTTNATLTVSGEPTVGNEVVVTATVGGVPVRDAAVRLDGQRVGTTDASGRVRVRLPDSPGNVTISVSRGAVSGETTVTVPELNVSVTPVLPVALPGAPVEVRATYGGEPLGDARVRVGGTNLTTDFNGTAATTLPFRGSATVMVSARGQTRRTTVSGLFVNLAAVLGGAVAVLGGLGLVAHRRGVGPRRLAGLVVTGLRALPTLAIAALFGAADRLERAVATLIAALGDLRAGETTVGELLDRLRTWLAERVDAANRRVSRSLGGRVATDASDEPNGDESYRTLREAWDAFLGAVSVRRPQALTPGELADHAVRQDDLPADAVETLRDAFRDVEYGARSPADRLPQVEAAAETIERATRDPDPESADDAGGET